jgi:hypothetical protein
LHYSTNSLASSTQHRKLFIKTPAVRAAERKNRPNDADMPDRQSGKKFVGSLCCHCIDKSDMNFAQSCKVAIDIGMQLARELFAPIS